MAVSYPPTPSASRQTSLGVSALHRGPLLLRKRCAAGARALVSSVVSLNCFPVQTADDSSPSSGLAGDNSYPAVS